MTTITTNFVKISPLVQNLKCGNIHKAFLSSLPCDNKLHTHSLNATDSLAGAGKYVTALKHHTMKLQHDAFLPHDRGGQK